MTLIKRKTHVHFIGIGGIGMSGIAEILLSLGHSVSGSDLKSSPTTEKLFSLGAKIYLGHKEENISEATVVVFSSAVSRSNPEMIGAEKLKLPIMRRAEMLAQLMRLKKGIAIAGSHGKTTTTSMLATMLKESHYDPTYIIGGIVTNLDGHARVGTGELLVAEADESDGSFLLLNPIYSIITNIDNDHLDFYQNEQNLYNAFEDFLNLTPFYGICSINAEDSKLVKMASSAKRPCLTFAFEESYKEADFVAKNYSQKESSSSFILSHENESINIKLNLPGKHNVLNFLGAASIAYQLGLSLKEISESIKKFEGVGRRFQKIFKREKFEIIDDYGHHPTEIQKTIEALVEYNNSNSNQQKIIFFEPHRFTRTRDCWKEFIHSFKKVDKVFIAPIYSASEDSIEGISATRLAQEINKIQKNQAMALESIEDMKKILTDSKDKNWTVLTLGAGSIGKIIREWVNSES